MPEILGHNFIAGQRSAAGTQRLQSLDATTGEALPYSFAQATEAEVDQAAQAAAAAFAEFRQLPRHAAPSSSTPSPPSWTSWTTASSPSSAVKPPCPPPASRANVAAPAARCACSPRCCAAATSSGAHRPALPERQPLPRVDLRQMRIGVGPVAVFGASNFPLAFSTAGGDTAAALAAGCPVVFKAHSGHMATADLVSCAIERAAEAHRHAQGRVQHGLRWRCRRVAGQAPGDPGRRLHRLAQGGDALCDMAAERPQPIPVFAEMSSINPVIICRAPWPSVARPSPANWPAPCAWVRAVLHQPGPGHRPASPQFSRFWLTWPAPGPQAGQTMLNAGGLRSYKAAWSTCTPTPVSSTWPARPGGNQARAQLFKADARLLVNGDPLLQEEVFGPTTVAVEVATTSNCAPPCSACVAS
jgi:NADP-dependent aldehyde dehydrogenase